VSPQNILLGEDGSVRVTDFGIAKASGRLQTTQDGEVKGKAGYMAPEQIRGRPLDRRADLWAASVVLWELLAGRRLFFGESSHEVMNKVLEMPLASPGGPAPVDALVMRGLSREPAERFSNARDMAVELERSAAVATPREIAEWLQSVAGETLRERAEKVRRIEQEPLEASAPPEPTRVHRRALPRRLFPVLGLVAAAAAGALAVRAGMSSHEALSAPTAVARPAAVPVEPAPTPVPAPLEPAPPPLRPAAPAPRKTSAPAARKPNCTPPYTTDAAGVRHWKDGC